MRRLERKIAELNTQVYNPVGLNILWPQKVAFLFVSLISALGCIRNLTAYPAVGDRVLCKPPLISIWPIVLIVAFFSNVTRSGDLTTFIDTQFLFSSRSPGTFCIYASPFLALLTLIYCISFTHFLSRSFVDTYFLSSYRSTWVRSSSSVFFHLRFPRVRNRIGALGNVSTDWDSETMVVKIQLLGWANDKEVDLLRPTTLV
jgi:hypothetical protein